jgi:hypothetical protein
MALGETWEAGRLAAFLLDPGSASGDKPHLRRLRERYLVEMPPVTDLGKGQLDLLVAYLLSEP